MSPKGRRLDYSGKLGSHVPTSSFDGFSPSRVLASYNGPLLQEMLSPRGESWLFSWIENDNDVEADNPPERAIINTWIAFRVSPERLREVEEDVVSLRDAILAAEYQIYLVTGPISLRPTQVRALGAGDLPKVGLPAIGTTLHGKESQKSLSPTPASRKLSLGFRISSDSISKGALPFGISGAFQDRFQRWLSEAAHHAFDPSPRKYELTYKAGDWSNVNELATGVGSFTIDAVTDGEPFELDRVDESLSYLQRLLTDPKSGKSETDGMVAGVGRSGSFALFSLLNFLMATKVSVEISWGTGGTAKRIRLDPESARAVVLRLHGERRKIESDARLTVPLSADDLRKLRLPVVGIGGLQSLLRELQRQVGEDGRLSVTPAQIERILRYSQAYGSGGFQGRLQGVLVELKRLAASLSSLR